MDMLISYVVKNIVTGETFNYCTQAFLEIGTIVNVRGVQAEVIDFTVEDMITCEDLCESRRTMRRYGFY